MTNPTTITEALRHTVAESGDREALRWRTENGAWNSLTFTELADPVARTALLVLGVEWLPDSDELTPISKLKRRAIKEKYAEEIEHLYRP